MRLVLDANVVIAAAATRGLCEAVFELCLERYQIISGEALLDEVDRGLRRKLRLPPEIAAAYLRLLRETADIIAPAAIESGICRDPNDEMVLGLAVAGGADLIVSGDKDLLEIGQFGTVRIVAPRAFWEAATRG